MKEENGHKLDSANCSESTLKCGDLMGPDNASEDGTLYFRFRCLELKSLH